MNSEVAGSIPTVLPGEEKKKKGFSHVQEPEKLDHSKKNNDESNVL